MTDVATATDATAAGTTAATGWDPGAFLEGQVCRLAGHLLLLAPTDDFLRETASALLGEAVSDAETLAGALSSLSGELGTFLTQPEQAELPLVTLGRSFELTVFELDLLLCALLPELDERFGEVFQSLRGGARRRPTLGLALRALLPGEVRWRVRRFLRQSSLWRSGLLLQGDPELPFPDRDLRPATVLAAVLEGDIPSVLSSGAAVRLLEPESDRKPPEPARDLIRWLAEVETGLVHLIQPPGGSDRTQSLAQAIAAGLGRPLMAAGPIRDELGQAVREALIAAAAWASVPLIELAPEIRRLDLNRATLPPLPVLVAAPQSLVLELPHSLPLRRVIPVLPRPLEQARLWERLLAEADASARVELLANRTRLTAAEMARIVALAAHRARLDGRQNPEHRDVAAALEELVPDPAPALARVRRSGTPWSRLVLNPGTRLRLERLVRRVQHRVTVQDLWGMRQDDGRGNGLTALLHGEPGTGKTLAAEAVATQLDLPLVSVDLSRVVSKYIGETEKNLAAVFEATEGYRGVLFFDEADALFGKRTGVRDAHDRYANLEINFLLERLEDFEGIVLLATNLRQNMDQGFTRRLQLVIHFPRPGPAQQRVIWERHLPAAQLAEDVDLDALTRFDLVGGEIRNASLAAAYEAAAQDVPISQDLLVQACREDLVKRGRPIPEGAP